MSGYSRGTETHIARDMSNLTRPLHEQTSLLFESRPLLSLQRDLMDECVSFREIIKIMGLEGKVTQQQCKKKWENLKKKYKVTALSHVL